MREFARLYGDLDATTSTSRKLDALKKYFNASESANAAWAVYFLAGGKPRQAVSTKLLRQFSTEMSGISEWLFDECYLAVGDLAEAISLILPPPEYESNIGLAAWMEERILPLRGEQPEKIRVALFDYWRGLDRQARFLLIKLISGGFRVGVSKLLVIRALSELSGVDHKIIAQRMMGWTDGQVPPIAESYQKLIAAQPAFEQNATQGGQPYPFFLSHPLQTNPRTLGDIRSWHAEWKYDGIRAQLVQRSHNCYLWSRGEELITDRFPEIGGISLPDGTVIDGEILIWKNGRSGSFADLQRRIGRKTLSSKILDELPAVLIAFDLLEHEGRDIRHVVQLERRARLDEIVRRHGTSVLMLSPLIDAPDWRTLEVIRDSSRARGVEGLMLKSTGAQYGVGRTKESGAWWKWKLDPYTVDAVLVYAQKGHGRRASLYTDYTFAVWSDSPDSGRKLVPFAKAYSGLTDREIAQVDAVIRKTTVEKFGPVRSVTPTMVFEIGFEGIAKSSRHKSGIAVRFPRMLRMRDDKKIDQADTLDTLNAMIKNHG
ncbi:DNA ligase-1 [Nitrosospira sp. Nsp2]|uniref:ATP-dependent DNA ligase n=1 Tax=Nitrosospira sp. Nsp2 TaxID=136548 RepID=UPI000D32438D|nr:ATP-dependent DNA ligase [Nitrosospira sp. Nsp2]PTR16617.1 DNA ligase-1 [Nitrosospira sp. Nsp2]